MNYFYNPVRTYEGEGTIGLLSDVINSMNLSSKRVLIIGWCEKVLENNAFLKLSQTGCEVRSIAFTASNPTVEQLFEVYENTKDFAPDVVVAVGGGSIMDVGKSLCCLYGKEIDNVDMLREVIADKKFLGPSAKWIGIPTTAGTGSEVTCWATIWDPQKNAKRSIEDSENYAYAALVDPDLAKAMPVKLAVSSALDAAAHAVESYWAKRTNCASRAFALHAIKTIIGNIDSLLKGEEKSHEFMAQGSMLAGMAFSNTRTTACHSISYPLTMHYNIPHGAAVSMLLAPVLKMNAESIDGIEALLDALGVKDADMLKERIESILKQSGQPVSLKEWGVKENDLDMLAKQGITKGRADNNPIEITEEKVKSILESIY